MTSSVEQRFATSFLYGLSLKKTKYSANFEPNLHSLGPVLPTASRPFSLETNTAEKPVVNSIQIELKFKLLKTALTFELSVSPLEMVESLKCKVANELDIPADQIRLVCGGKGLNDGKTVADYNLSSAQVIHIMKKPGSGTADSDSNAMKTGFIESANVTQIDPIEEELCAASMNSGFWYDLEKLLKKYWNEKENADMVISIFKCLQ